VTGRGDGICEAGFAVTKGGAGPARRSGKVFGPVSGAHLRRRGVTGERHVEDWDTAGGGRMQQQTTNRGGRKK